MQSMTGYGRAQNTVDGYRILVEYKSVNHRYFEFSARLPRNMGFLEAPLKETVGKVAARGKVEAAVTVIPPAGENMVAQLQLPLAKQYLTQLRAAAEPLGLTDDLTLRDLLRLPELFQLEKEQEDAELILSLVLPVAEEAAAEFAAMRRTEGERLQTDILKKLDEIETLVGQVEALSPQTVARYRQRLAAKMQEVLADQQIDEGRLLTEAAIFADRIAVDEETTRLRSHLAQYRDLLRAAEPVGRKLDFLTQEVNRELNTIGSKAQDVLAAQLVVDGKSVVEKIREQIQNIE